MKHLFAICLFCSCLLVTGLYDVMKEQPIAWLLNNILAATSVAFFYFATLRDHP